MSIAFLVYGLALTALYAWYAWWLSKRLKAYVRDELDAYFGYDDGYEGDGSGDIGEAS